MNRTMKILLTSSAMFLLAGGLFAPIYAIFVERIGGDLLAAGSAYAAFAISAGVLLFFISRWEDHIKHKEKLIVGGWVLSCIGYAGYMFVREPWHLVIVQVVFGIGTAICNPAFDGLYSKSLDRGKFASEWGMWESMSFIVTAIAALIGSYVADLYGFGTLFSFMFAVSIIGLAIALLLFRR